jgi:hypothetical protein
MNVKTKIKTVISAIAVAAAMGVGSNAFAGPYCVTPFGTFFLGPMPAGISCWVNVGPTVVYGFANY